jgi:hypothetical protein
MEHTISRREALKRLSIAAGTLLVIDRASGTPTAKPPAARDTSHHLTPSDPAAEALSYHDNAAKVNPEEFSEYKPGQKCANCAQLVGVSGEKWRPCVLVPGTLVSADGWCQAYTKKA